MLVETRDGRFLKPETYICYRAKGEIIIDGKLNDPSWKRAPWTSLFVDIEGNDVRPPPRYATRVMMVWDDEYLYIAADLEEPDVWGTLTQRDSIIYHDNDFEVFIKPREDSTSYVELEVNALNTVFDLYLDKPYYMSGKPDIKWDFKGLKHAVYVDGTLNYPYDVDKGWSIEIAIPWESLEILGITEPPIPGEQWRINFSRVEYERELVGKYCDNWVWSPTGEINMHLPVFWGIVQFSNIIVGEGVDRFRERPEKITGWWKGFENRLRLAPDRGYLKKYGRISAWEEKQLREKGLL